VYTSIDVGAHEALSIDNEQLKEVNSIKYLGVEIDYELDFQEHLAMIVKKIAKQIRFSWKNFPKADE
jgi:hypothetical protein